MKRVFRLWEETGVTGENQCMHEKNMQTLGKINPDEICTRL